VPYYSAPYYYAPGAYYPPQYYYGTPPYVPYSYGPRVGISLHLGW
jgi:hypothetical protein